ncbi:MAG: succinate dehydrogenase cytochrome b subunit [Elusimicrobia bacterium]|jgi:succinate dehydrogenase / fumarate reductase cytochrome b subunit|nr:succinate dehydrogenase cytochrome b subunit [Elusimicrobiota bacterium]
MDITFLKRFVTTSIGRKAVMAASGLMLGGFMLVHLAENLLLFKGEAAYNGWVDLLLSNPVTPFLEVGLLAVFLAHIAAGVWVRVEDFLNAPRGYEARKWQGGRTIGSATMLYTAAAILAYLVYHMLTFRFVDHSMGFYQMVTGAFRAPVFTAVYIAGAAALALHLSHGMQSAFQTLGLSHPKYTPLIKLGGLAVAVLMIGFALISLYFLAGVDLKAAEAGGQMVVIN